MLAFNIGEWGYRSNLKQQMYQSLTRLLPQYEAFVSEGEESVDESRTQTGAVCQCVCGLPRRHGGKEPGCQCRRRRRHGFHPWVGRIPWRRAWQPTAVFLPGEPHGQRSLAGYSPRGCKGSDTAEAAEHTHEHRSRGAGERWANAGHRGFFWGVMKMSQNCFWRRLYNSEHAKIQYLYILNG